MVICFFSLMKSLVWTWYISLKNTSWENGFVVMLSIALSEHSKNFSMILFVESRTVWNIEQLVKLSSVRNNFIPPLEWMEDLSHFLMIYVLHTYVYHTLFAFSQVRYYVILSSGESPLVDWERQHTIDLDTYASSTR